MCQLISIIRRTTSKKKIWEPTQNSRRQEGHMKRVPHRVPTNIRRHDTKFGLAGDLEPGKSRIPVYTSIIPVENSKGNPIQTYASLLLPFLLQHPFPSLHLRAFSYSVPLPPPPLRQTISYGSEATITWYCRPRY